MYRGQENRSSVDSERAPDLSRSPARIAANKGPSLMIIPQTTFFAPAETDYQLRATLEALHRRILALELESQAKAAAAKTPSPKGS